MQHAIFLQSPDRAGKFFSLESKLGEASTSSLTDMMQAALDRRISHVWTNVNFPDVEKRDWNLLIQEKEGKIKSVTGWLPSSNQVQVIFIRNSTWARGRGADPWGAVATPKQILTTVNNLQTAFRKHGPVTKWASPGSAGWQLFENIHPEWVKDNPKTDLRSLGFFAGIKGAAHDLTYEVPFQDGKYLHKVDRNSAYLYSSTFDLAYGVGEPMKDADGSKFDKKLPGVWYCDVCPTEEALPDYPRGTYKLATPILNLMNHLKYDIDIHYGHYFPNSHQLMAQWATFLWNGRQSFSEGSFERQAIKQMAVSTIGLASYKGYDLEEDTDKRRPDIKCLTVARTYELMYHSILKMRRQSGKMPFMCYMDALYYESDSSNRDFLAPLTVKERELGGFKYEGHILITPEIADVLHSNMPSHEKLAYLNRIGWSK